MNAFWRPRGGIFRPFSAYVEVKDRLGGSLRARLRLEADFLGSTPHFGGFWKAFREDFGDILVSFFDVDFTMNFYMILN